MSKTYRVSKSYLENHFKGSYMMVDCPFRPEGKNTPLISITKTGKKWFWIAAKSYSEYFDVLNDPAIGKENYPLKGYAETKEQALADGQAAIGFTPPDFIPRYACGPTTDGKALILRELTKTNRERICGYDGAGIANGYLRYANAAKKAAAPTPDTEDGQVMEFAYIEGSYSCEPERHKILKRTKKRIYVDSWSFREDGAFTEDDPVMNYARKKYVFDREKFDAGEILDLPGRWYYKVYNEARKKIRDLEREKARLNPVDGRFSTFKVLKLEHPFTVENVKRSYRKLAKAMHPDAGGDAGEFILLKQEYESAMAMIG